MKPLAVLGGLVSFVLILVPYTGVAGSRVGNGGDVPNQILQNARLQVVSGADYLLARPRTDLAKYCQKGMLLSNAQAEECSSFIWAALPQIIAINQRRAENSLLINEPGKPIDLDIPNQKNRCFDSDPAKGDCFIADAATATGEAGYIIFRYEFLVSPLATRRNIITLLFHEYGHKIEYKGHYIEDSSLPQTFSWGWQLLDAAAAGFTAYLFETHNLQDDIKIMDRFQCDTFQNGLKVPSNPTHDFKRIFKGDGPKRFQSFETGFCIGEVNCPYVPISSTQERLLLRLHIFETRNCAAPAAQTAMAKNRFELVALDDFGREKSVVASYKAAFPDPVCKEIHDPMELEYMEFKFVCRYVQTNVE